MEALKTEFFIGYQESEKKQRKLEVEELLEMQRATFTLQPVGGGGGVLTMQLPGSKR